ncbi:uncharacterized protein TrAtP1_010625 [Trichoderma atroviride]|uniref:uncharacterized protein n=1 Tax=Hypocrea atroviridis TaxID=63577 RepID=UPI003329BD56|nr:hypothetical protein TrAtP1_010625 [Trichoderma atroviride]
MALLFSIKSRFSGLDRYDLPNILPCSWQVYITLSQTLNSFRVKKKEALTGQANNLDLELGYNTQKSHITRIASFEQQNIPLSTVDSPLIVDTQLDKGPR